MHTCPHCGQACYCGGDIDDMECSDGEDRCNHCDWTDDEDFEQEELTMNCNYPGCCMPGLHFPSECHNAQDMEALEEYLSKGRTCDRVTKSNT
jgi:hypothetical protein